MTVKGGPKTLEGKLISSQNSLKHGLTATGLLNDTEAELLHNLQAALFDEHSPQTMTEELLVSDLPMIRVKLARFDDVETNLFKTAEFDSNQIRTVVRNMRLEDENIEQKLTKALQHKSGFITEAQRDIVEELRGIKLENFKLNGESALQNLPKAMKHLKEECEALTLGPSFVIARATRLYEEGEKYLPPMTIVTSDTRDIIKPDLENDIPELTAAQIREYLKALKAKWNQSIEMQNLYNEAIERLENTSYAALPDQSNMDRLYRYRTALEKQFSNKLGQLIQLQEMRERKARIASRS